MKLKYSTAFTVTISALLISAALFSVGFYAGRISAPFSKSTIAIDTNESEVTFEPYIQAWNVLNRN